MGDLQTFDEFLTYDEPPDAIAVALETGSEFVVDTREKAEWAMRKISRAEARIQESAAAAQSEIAKAQAYIDRIRTRLHEINRADEQTVEYLGQLIRPWAEVEIAKGGKAKSVKLLGGTIGFRHSQPSLEVTDEAEAIEWLEGEAGGAFVITKKSVDKVGVKKHVTDGGALPDGCSLVPGEIRFYVEAAPLEIEEKRKEVANG